ncbi:MAG TPA: hypothetical protein VGQ99_11050 [Tepidisphaeraceae bacterium]|jgi:hypothetical protein|nr:hypothetical protein [Tepidisphaeraceae bacterium]
MLKLVTIAGRVVLGASGLLMTGCAVREYRDGGGYYRPVGRSYYERTDYRYGGDRHYDRDSYRHRERYNDRYGRCD